MAITRPCQGLDADSISAGRSQAGLAQLAEAVDSKSIGSEFESRVRYHNSISEVVDRDKAEHSHCLLALLSE